MRKQYFESKKDAQYYVKTMIGYKTRIIYSHTIAENKGTEHQDYYLIQCNGNKYLYEDGFVR